MRIRTTVGCSRAVAQIVTNTVVDLDEGEAQQNGHVVELQNSTCVGLFVDRKPRRPRRSRDRRVHNDNDIISVQ